MQLHNHHRPQTQTHTSRNRPKVYNDTLAEWLRRRPAKPMGSPRVGSNPTGVGLQVAALRRFGSAKVGAQKRGCSGN